ncbi:MAG: flagellar FliJ family protein [Thermoguttaceae bacterium]|nr:flagellar FliJ family protein [Thermoguttaceae bacterium]MBQ9456214.1 flagellar FliJ family protein [Thermoguttaceae bacterium]MDO4857134.1 flagellar FliJ family protein [Thermoguttaceae bacterium]
MPFQFRLQAVQKVQEFKRDAEKQTLSDLLAQQNALAAEEEKLQKELGDSQVEREKLMRGGTFDAAQLQAYSQFESHLKQKLEEIHQKQNALTQVVESQRETVLQAEQEVKKFEKLEEKQREEYKKKHK